jgi:hypothetical protein
MVPSPDDAERYVTTNAVARDLWRRFRDTHIAVNYTQALTLAHEDALASARLHFLKRSCFVPRIIKA